mgnify:CR=1 FL=1
MTKRRLNPNNFTDIENIFKMYKTSQNCYFTRKQGKNFRNVYGNT